MNYLAIGIYLLAAYLVRRAVKRMFLMISARNFIKSGSNTPTGKVLVCIGTYVFAFLWPVLAVHVYIARRYRKLRRLISKKK